MACLPSRTPPNYPPPDHWGYVGVVFDAQLAMAHGEVLGLPMFDRSPAELIALEHESPQLDRSEPHDFPILKVPYDPNRTELP